MGRAAFDYSCERSALPVAGIPELYDVSEPTSGIMFLHPLTSNCRIAWHGLGCCCVPFEMGAAKERV